MLFRSKFEHEESISALLPGENFQKIDVQIFFV